MSKVIGVISDTHGLLRPEAVNALIDCEIIIHAGDIGKQLILDKLYKIAPVVAVRGNVDKGTWAEKIPKFEATLVDNKFVYVLHNIDELDIEPASKFDIVISGHTHKSQIRINDNVIYINPGSAGPKRFNYKVTVAKINITDDKIDAEIVELE